MKTDHFLTISLSLVLGLALCTAAGCKKKEVTSNGPSEAANTTEGPVQAAAQPEAAVQAAVKAKPAVGENTIAEGHAFPSLEFTSLAGDPVSLVNLKGKVVLIDFWATWCGPCRRTMPDLVETYRAYHDQGFEIIGISLDKDQSQLEKYMQDMGITWPQYFDGLGWSNKIAQRFAVRAIPHIVLIDKTGAVHFNTDHKHDKPPLHGVELRNAVGKLCSARLTK
ncbi:MAG: TlpA family protein disulfide reductase [Planctomycetota bacterium]|jgi:thiol-disulfide isomerase/thioredoxin